MYRKLSIVSIIVLLLSLAFASVTFAQTGTTGNGGQNNSGQNNSNQANNNQGNNNQGTGTANAFTNLGQGRRVAAGQQQWYRFEYAGDNSPIQIRLSGPGVQFSVWTQQDLANAGGNFGSGSTPTARSTANSSMNSDQYWTGQFNTAGPIFVMVERSNNGQGDSGNQNGDYTLQITGTGVSFRGQSGNNQSSSNTSSNGSNSNTSSNQSSSNSSNSSSQSAAPRTLPRTGADLSASNQSGTTGSNSSSQSSSNSTSKSGSNTSSGGTSGATPKTLPRTGGEMASVLPILMGGLGAFSVAAGALLRRKR